MWSHFATLPGFCFSRFLYFPTSPTRIFLLPRLFSYAAHIYFPTPMCIFLRCPHLFSYSHAYFPTCPHLFSSSHAHFPTLPTSIFLLPRVFSYAAHIYFPTPTRIFLGYRHLFSYPHAYFPTLPASISLLPRFPTALEVHKHSY